MKVYWPTDKTLYVPVVRDVEEIDPTDASTTSRQVIVGGELVHHPAGTLWEMPDEEALDRIRQGDCVRWVEADRPPPVNAQTGQEAAESTTGVAPLTDQEG